MSHATPPPHEIRYHSRSRVLEVSFADGCRFELPADTLRARSADGAGTAAPAAIARIAPRGDGGIVLHFEDGHASAPLSWSELYRLGAGAAVAGGGRR